MHMLTSIKPIIDEPAKLPNRPDIIMNEVAIPRYFVGNKFTPTDIINEVPYMRWMNV